MHRYRINDFGQLLRGLRLFSIRRAKHMRTVNELITAERDQISIR